MSKRISFLSVFFFAFLFFVIFSYFIHRNLFTSLDFDTTLNLQDKLPDFLISPFSVFSILGTAEIATLFLLSLWFIFPLLRKIHVLIFYVLTQVIEVIGKSIISQIAPPVELLKTNLHVGFPSGSISADFFSYPSGHAARTTFISVILLFALWKSSKPNRNFKFVFIFLILTFDFIMLLSRVYLGEHWISDVIGGGLLGFSLAVLSFYFIKIKSAK